MNQLLLMLVLIFSAPAWASGATLSAQTTKVLLGKDTLKVELWRAPIKVDTVILPGKVDTVRVGLSMGTYGRSPTDSLGKPGYPMRMEKVTGDRGTVLRDLARVKAAHARAFLVLPRRYSKDETKADIFSVAKARAYLDSMPDITPYVRDGTLMVGVIHDDNTKAEEWGPGVPYFPQTDSVAMYWVKKWPGIIPVARVLPTKLAGYPWKYLKGGWAQYVKGKRDGPLDDYLAKQVASAKAQHLCLVLGLNVTASNEDAGMNAVEFDTLGRKLLNLARAEPALIAPALIWYTYEEPNNTLIRPGVLKLKAVADTTVRPRGCS